MISKTPKKILAILLIMVMAFMAIACGGEEQESGEVFDNKAEATWNLLTIIYPDEAGLENIVDYKVYSINQETTPLEVLLSFGDATKTPVVMAEGPFAYVQGITGIFENDFIAPSGWVYTVNDEVIMESASDYKVKAEDKIKWSYVTFTEETFN